MMSKRINSELFNLIDRLVVVKVGHEDHLNGVGGHGPEGECHGHVVQDLDGPLAPLPVHVHRRQQQEDGRG